jgi:hypothetical protein
MADAQTKIFPFSNKGWVQKLDPAQLGDGQYQLLQNAQSFQEGTISSRNGSKRLTAASPASVSSTVFINSLAKLRVDSTHTYRYFGHNTNLYRSGNSGYSTIAPGNFLDTLTFVTIAAGLCSSASDRIAGIQYDSGPSGIPVAYFGGSAAMKMDDGTRAAPALRWGIMPLDQAVVATAVIASLGISGISIDTAAEVTTAAPHGLSTGTMVTISGAVGTGWTDVNATWQISVTGASTFTIPIDSSGFGALSGTIVYTTGGSDLLVPYSYCATARDPVTGSEGNPSPLMIDALQITQVGASGVSLAIGGIDSDNGRISTTSGDKSIAVYRAGGTLDDGLYRKIGYTTNPGSGSTVTYVDTAQDIDIVNGDILEFDNDPPVPSALKIPLVSPINYSSSTLHHGAVSTFHIDTADMPTGITDLRTVLTPGSIVRITGIQWWPGPPSVENITESAIIRSVTTANEFTAYTQQQFWDGGTSVPITVEVTTACAHGANIGCSAFENIFLAGDDANPSVLYKCKNGRPESWPLLNMTSGSVQQLRVGSPSNPIRGITEFNGELVCLNAANIFVVGFAANGKDMRQASATPATHGVVGKEAWVKADNQIWYVGADGLYSWRGGQETLRSLAVEFMFRGLTVNGIAPINMTKPEKIIVGYHQNIVFISFEDTSGKPHRMRYETLFDRWNYDIVDDFGTASTVGATAMLTETDTNLLTSAKLTGSTECRIHQENVGFTDGWVTDPASASDGIPPTFIVDTAAYDLGDRLLDKQFSELGLEAVANGSCLVETFYDYGSSIDETFSFPNSVVRSRASFSIQSGSGKEASVMSFRITGGGGSVRTTLYSMLFNTIPLTRIQVGAATDWTDCGHPFDKRFYQLLIEYNTSGTDVVMNVDTISGITGATHTSAVATFTLNSAVRAQATLPFPDGVIAKKVRLRPTVGSTTFRVWRTDFKVEKYPEDIVAFTETEDGGTPELKYGEQITFNVDTGGKDVPVKIQADGTTVQTLTVNSTATDRERRYTLLPNLSGRRWRLYVDTTTVPSGGKFQLFDHQFKFLPADKGPVAHTYDWDDLGHPYDKRLYTVAMEWDNVGGAAVTMAMDTLSGIDGATIAAAVETFSLPPGTRQQKTFPITDGLIVKKVKFYPQGTPGTAFRLWWYKVTAENYPPDVVPFTEPEDGGYPSEKYAQELFLDVDTAGHPVPVQVQADGTTLQTLIMTTTPTDRRRRLTLSPELSGRQWRLLVDPSLIPAGGKFQLFAHQFKFLPVDKGPVEHSAGWDDIGHPFDKRLKTVTIDFNTSGTDTTMEMDTISGINGNTTNLAVASFVLSGADRAQKTFAVPDGNVVKKIRLRPLGDNTLFKMWGYQFDLEKYPADSIAATEYSDLGHPYEKNPKNLCLNVDTGGVAATVEVWTDGAIVQTFSVDTTASTRRWEGSFDRDIFGKIWRLLITPGAGGKFQMWEWKIEATNEPSYSVEFTDWNDFGYPYEKVARNLVLNCNSGGEAATVQVEGDGIVLQTFYVTTTNENRQIVLPFDTEKIARRFRLLVTPGTAHQQFKLYSWNINYVREPATVTYWNSLPMLFGFAGHKLIKQIWIEYRCASAPTFSIYRDNGQLFWQETLPIHAWRDIERFYLPPINGLALNKSKTYEFTMSAATPFAFYRDGTRIEVKSLSGDQRSAYEQKYLFESQNGPDS